MGTLSNPRALFRGIDITTAFSSQLHQYKTLAQNRTDVHQLEGSKHSDYDLLSVVWRQGLLFSPTDVKNDIEFLSQMESRSSVFFVYGGCRTKCVIYFILLTQFFYVLKQPHCYYFV